MLVNVMSKKIQFVNTKEALIRVDNDAMSSEAFENNSQVLEVLFWSGTSDENIINVRIGEG